MERSRIARAAMVIMVGNLVTSILGFVRQAVTARYFGSGGSTDAWFAAYTVPQMFYDLVIGGAIAAALIPSFTRLAESGREEFWRVVTTVFVLAALALLFVVGILEIAANPLMSVIASGFNLRSGHHHHTLATSVRLVRVILPTLFFWGLSAVSLATLYSLGKRVAASFATACFHLGIILAAVLLASPLGVISLPIGAVAGSASQLLVQLPSLIRSRREIVDWFGRHVDLRDPAVRKIAILYGPVALGIVVSIAGQIADVNFKSHLHPGYLSDMQYATTLIQFPVGIVVAALGLAVLPLISSDAAAGRTDSLKEKLGLGFRLVMLLMIPAAVGYEVLGPQIIALLFERGRFGSGDVTHTVAALGGYAPQLPFIGIDQLLIFAFYARHNTVTPMLVGVFGVCVYIAFAFLLIGPWNILGLALANTIQIALHALVLLVLLLRSLGAFHSLRLGVTFAKVCLSSGVMAVVALLTLRGVETTGLTQHHLGEALVPVAAAILVYSLAVYILRVEEIQVLRDSVASRLRFGTA